MQLYCPSCRGTFAGLHRCPRCDVLLLMPHEAAIALSPVLTTPLPEPSGGVGRGAVHVALVVAGLFVGLLQLWQAGPVLLGQDAAQWRASLPGLSTLYAIEAVAIVCGGLVAAAARPYGASLGLLVGLVGGCSFFLWELWQQADSRNPALLLQIPILAWLGVLAGYLGQRIWLPPPVVELPQPRSSRLSSLQFARASIQPPPAPPIRWWRIVAGAAIAVLMLLYAEVLPMSFQRYVLRQMAQTGIGPMVWVVWLVGIGGMVAGGVIAGATTQQGARHGFLAGLLAAPILIAITLRSGELPPPLEMTLARVGMAGVPASDPAAAGLCLGLVLFGMTLGGWFGSVLMPPLAPPSMRRRPRLGMD